MKGTDSFKKVIIEHLEQAAFNDPEFEKKYNDPKKNIDDCITYILNTVKNTGANGFTDSEVYGMAMHFFDEKQIDIGKEIKAEVLINRHVELSTEEKEQIRKEAREAVFEEQRKAMTKKPKKVVVEAPKEDKEIQQSLF